MAYRLADLHADLGRTYLVISHDLNVVRLLCDHVVVMKDGAAVEHGPTAAVMDAPTNPYTRALLDAAPNLPTTAFQDRSEGPLA